MSDDAVSTPHSLLHTPKPVDPAPLHALPNDILIIEMLTN